jgi:4-hydroxybutyrate dehydrogenase
LTGDFDFPTRIAFGPGRVRELGELTREYGRRALLVTDPGVLRSGAVEPVQDVLHSAGMSVVVFDGVESNPVEANVQAGLARFREGCEFLVAVGGGSPIDAAKAIRLLAAHEGPLRLYTEEDAPPIRPVMPPLVAVPTTAGTGSEVGRSTVVTLDDRKYVIFSPHLIPTLALCDPELTLGMPPAVTAGTGADALIHNLEAYFALGYHPMCDAIALGGIERAWHSLPIAVRDGQDLEARTDMMIAALMGAVAFQKGLGVVHSLAHPLSTLAGAHHGTANAVMLPHALRFNREAIAGRAAPVARAIEVEPSADGGETVDRLAIAVEALFQEIGLPTRLEELGVTPEMVDRLADLAIVDGCHLLNPRPLTRDDMAVLYHAAM